jgi:hypothetical protein
MLLGALSTSAHKGRITRILGRVPVKNRIVPLFGIMYQYVPYPYMKEESLPLIRWWIAVCYYLTYTTCSYCIIPVYNPYVRLRALSGWHQIIRCYQN